MLKRKIIKRRRNPELKSFSKNDTTYIKLSDFENEFIKEAKLILNKADLEYWEFDYEIDNILKYQLGSNAVNSGLLSLLSISDFKKILKDGLENRFSNDKDISKVYRNTIIKIPKNINWIDTGN